MIEFLPSSVHQRIAFYLFFKRNMLNLALTSSTMFHHILPYLWEDPWNLKFMPFKDVYKDELLFQTLSLPQRKLFRNYASSIKVVSSTLFPCDWSNEIHPTTLHLRRIVPPLLDSTSQLKKLLVQADCDIVGRLTLATSSYKFWHWFLRHTLITHLTVYGAQTLFAGIPSSSSLSTLTHLNLHCHVSTVQSAKLLSSWFGLPNLIELKLTMLSPLQANTFEPLLANVSLLTKLQSFFFSPCDDSLTPLLPALIYQFFELLPDTCLLDLELRSSSEYCKKYFFKSFIPYFQLHSLPQLRQLHILDVPYLSVDLLRVLPCSQLYLHLDQIPCNIEEVVPLWTDFTHLTWSPISLECLKILEHVSFSQLYHVAFQFASDLDFYECQAAIYYFVLSSKRLKSVYWKGPRCPVPHNFNACSSRTLSSRPSSTFTSYTSATSSNSTSSTSLSSSSSFSSGSSAESSSSTSSTFSISSPNSSKTLVWETHNMDWQSFIQYRELDDQEDPGIGSKFTHSISVASSSSLFRSKSSTSTSSSSSYKQSEAECYLSLTALQKIRATVSSTDKRIDNFCTANGSISQLKISPFSF
ncbi:hypothetical protein HMI54_006147 [Coelomomyces lativittatus]|nr:hypothetical protein HMI54_006147 [Coelomomyces lativittatus]